MILKDHMLKDGQKDLQMYHEIDKLRPDEVEYLVRKYDDEQI